MTLVAPHVQSQCGPLFGLRVFLRDLVCVFIFILTVVALKITLL